MTDDLPMPPANYYNGTSMMAVKNETMQVDSNSPALTGNPIPMARYSNPIEASNRPTPSPNVLSGPQLLAAKDGGDGAIKCLRFFQTVLRPKEMQTFDVRRQIVSLVKAALETDFDCNQITVQLQSLLSSKAQPHLTPFLEKTLPKLREAILNGEVFFHVDSSGQTAVLDFARTQPPPEAPMEGHMQLAAMPALSSEPIRQEQAAFRNEAMHHSMEVDARPPLNTEPQFIPQQEQHSIPPPAPPVSVQHIAQQQQQSQEEDVSGLREYVPQIQKPNFINARIIMQKITDRMKTPCYVDEELISLLSEASEEKLRNFLVQLAVMAQHRVDPNPKFNPGYKPIDDVKAQLKWIETYDQQLEEQRAMREKEEYMRAGKSKSASSKDNIEKAKDMQRAEQEAKRNRDANAAANAALGISNLRSNKWDSSSGPSHSQTIFRNRNIRINMRDFQTVLFSSPKNRNSNLLFKLALGTPSTDAM